jgi:Tfp pilus assembly protein PilV
MTLLEVMLATILLAIIISAGGGFIWRSASFIQKSEQRLTALNYADYIMELLMISDNTPLSDGSNFSSLTQGERVNLAWNGSTWDQGVTNWIYSPTNDPTQYVCSMSATREFFNGYDYLEVTLKVAAGNIPPVELTSIKEIRR